MVWYCLTLYQAVLAGSGCRLRQMRKYAAFVPYHVVRLQYNSRMPSFSSLFGQASAIASLRRSVAGDSLPGSYLFVGAPGIGKGALSRAMAKAAACLNPTSDPADSCGICDSCRRLETGTQPEIQTILPAGEQTQIWQFWERDSRPDSGLLTRTLNYAPIVGRRRVYIIERAETLTESAANSLLKVLEEPPPYVLFILSAPHPARVLPTIVSRSQMIRLIPAVKQDLARYLTATFNLKSRGQPCMPHCPKAKRGRQ